MNVLVISYFFPPFNRVGGRRWAKHAKYMNRMDTNTFVLAGEFLNTTSSWDNDVAEYSDKVTRVKLLKRREPFFKTKLPEHFAEKIKWKSSFYSWNIRKIFLRGNYKDISINNSEVFLNKADELIKQKSINLVILSVGPFRYSEIIIKLKEKYPDVKFVIDYRDKREDGYDELSSKQIEFETQQQVAVLKNVDAVLTVNQNISESIKKINPKLKIFTLPHCVDEDFFNLGINNYFKSNHEKENFIYGGELYNGLDNEIKTFVSFFKNYTDLCQKKCEAFFYLPYNAYQKELSVEGIQTSQLISNEKYQKQLVGSDFILLFRPDWSLDAFSSKFFEILSLRKPVLYFGNNGAVSEFLVKNNLGFHISQNNLNEMLSEIIRNKTSEKIPDLKFDLSKFTFEYNTKLLIEYLNRLSLNKN